MSEDKKKSRLVLGTAQLGIPYGVANKTGKPDERVALEIIKTAWENDVCEFDTAQGYGESEKVLGEVFLRLGISGKVRVISKFDPRIDHTDCKVLLDALDQTLTKLHAVGLYGILLHHEKLLDQWSSNVGENFRFLLKTGKVKKVGVSVYSLKSALTALQIPEIGMIQLPANVFDQCFERSGFFDQAKKMNKEIYVRSVFLQGLLLMDPSDLPEYLLSAKKYLIKYRQICRRYNLTQGRLALGYAQHRMPGAKIVFGVETVDQLKENVLSWGEVLSKEILDEVYREFFNLPQKMINPTLWKK